MPDVPIQQVVTITSPNIQTTAFSIRGTSPLVIARFGEKARNEMMAKHAAGSVAKKGKARAAKDFEQAFNDARHLSTEGWDGIHAGAFRAGVISACRLVGFKMTLAKLSLFVEADGFDKLDGTPLVRIVSDSPPERSDLPVRNASGVIDIRTRPMWREWGAVLRVRFDGDQFTPTDAANLLARVGAQVGVGEGRADSRMSAGVGWGHFELV